MSMSTGFGVVTLNLHQSAIAVAACARAGRVPLLLGPPGVAKTTLVKAITPMVGKALGYADGTYGHVVCVLSNRDAVDVGGYPVVLSNDTVEQRLFGTLREASQRPCLLNLDEFLTCPQSVQGPALRLTLERVAGEVPLHDDTRIVCAANPPDQAPGGIQLTAALVNRVVMLHCRPTVQEVAHYFCGRPEASLVTDLDLPDDATWAARRSQFMDTAGILFESRTELLCFDPPQASISGGEPFASPRAWEMCCDVIAALPPAYVDAANDIMQALVLGAIGPGAGVVFLSIMRAKGHLPTVTEVLNNPDTARLPDPTIRVDDPANPGSRKEIGRDVTFAAIPLVIEAARVDTYAAWVYVARLPEEIQAAVAKSLAARLKAPPGSRWQRQGGKIMLDVIDRLTRPTEDKKSTRKAS